MNSRKLMETFAPSPDFAEAHQVDIAALPEAVFRALQTADLGKSPIVKGLFALRLLPERILSKRSHFPAGKLTLQSIIDVGFGRLAKEPGCEIVFGVSGKFWRLTGNLAPFDPDSFLGPVRPGTAQGVWNFRVSRTHAGKTILSTETRVTCGDAASRLKFRLYWLLIKPFSGFIRVMMLRAVRQAAESRTA